MVHKGSCLWLIFMVFWIGAPAAHAQEAEDQIRFKVEQFEVIGDNPIGKSAYRVLTPYVGEHYGLEGLSAAAYALEQAVIEAGYSFHRVSLPPQQLTTGTVQLKISSFTIGNIEIKGNRFFDENNILDTLPELRVGNTPNTKKLSRSLKLANTHAAKQMELIFKEGEEADTIDASLNVQDKNPQLVFVTLDNSGTRQVDEYRTTLGYQHGNLFNNDHAMTATLTTSPENPDAALQYGLNYRIPLYSQGASIDVLLSDSEVSSGTIGDLIQVGGKGSIFGVVYNKTLLSDSNVSHYWSFGLQYKLFENEIIVPVTSTSKVLSSPLELGYAFTRRGRSSTLSGGIKISVNVPGGEHSEPADYDTARIGSENEWSAIRFNISYDRLIGKEWLLHLGLSGQASDDLLISGEQFGVGGLSTLRGFEERSITGDAGQQASVELWMPRITSYQIRLLVFIDIASLKFNDDTTTTNVSSAGLGLRWSWKQNLNLSLDYGKIVEGGGPDTSINQDGDDKLHLELAYRF